MVERASEEVKKKPNSFLVNCGYSITMEFEKPKRVKGTISITKTPNNDKIPFCSGLITLVKNGIIANIIPLFIKDAIVNMLNDLSNFIIE